MVFAHRFEIVRDIADGTVVVAVVDVEVALVVAVDGDYSCVGSEDLNSPC